MLPFTQTQFFDVFEAYNSAIWPAPIAAYALGIALLIAVLLAPDSAGRAACLMISALWAWTGIAYHGMFFATVNPMASAFALLFVAHAVVFAVYGLRGSVVLGRGRGVAGVLAWSMIAYAMLAYPLLNETLGHSLPRAPVFGLTPCPLVIFTLGVLMLADARVPWPLLIGPLLWAAIGGSAAFLLNVAADLALPLAALLAVVMNATKPVVLAGRG